MMEGHKDAEVLFAIGRRPAAPLEDLSTPIRESKEDWGAQSTNIPGLGKGSLPV